MASSLKRPAVGVLSLGFLQAYLVTMRPYLMVLSGITGMAGLSLAPEVGLPRVGIVALASFLSYGFGQALTDCFQTDTDAISAPYRPLTQGVIGRGQVLGVSLAGLVLCVTAFAVSNAWNLLLGAIAAGGLATYTPLKRRWWGGPWYNAWIVGVLFIMGYLAGTGGSDVSPPSGLAWVLTAVFFAYANFVLAGYFKDIAADARSGYRTLPVVFGRRVSASVSDSLALMAGIALLVAKLRIPGATDLSLSNLLSWGLLVAGLGASLRAQILLHGVTRDEEAYRAIGPVVHSYILGLSAVSIAAQLGWAAAMPGLYVLFLIMLRARPSRSQI